MTDLSRALHLAEVLTARLCHDLSGIAGALDSSLEFLADDEPDADALPLARDAAVDLKARLRLLRAAWGSAEDPWPLASVKALAPGLPAYRRLSLDWSSVAPEAVFGAAFGRLALNLLMLAAECLPKGGTIRLMGGDDDLIVQPVGQDARWPSRFGACVADPTHAEQALDDPRALQMPLTVLLARAAGIRLSLLMPIGGTGGAPPVRLGGG